jgi:DNA-binding response OmpR family regulator
MDAKHGPTVLCVVDRRRNALTRLLRRCGFRVLETFTTDQAVAIAVANRVDAVVLDQDLFRETEGWSVAQSLKLVRPSIRVLLVTRSVRLKDRLPRGVDAMVSNRDPRRTLEAVQHLTHAKAAARSAGRGQP